MTADTTIEWTHFPGYTGKSWNPVTGCQKVASGCKNCYAEAVANRFWKDRKFTDVRTHADRLREPLLRKKPTCYFVNSMSDLFHEAVPFEFIAAVFGVMAACPQHLFIILTKRLRRMREFMEWWAESVERARAVFPHDDDAWRRGQCLYGSMLHFSTRPRAGMGQIALGEMGWPLPNVIHGYSASTQADLDAGMPDLLATPSALWCLSLEPLIGPVNLAPWLYEDCPSECVSRAHERNGHRMPSGRLGWVIVGGESGPGARPCDVAWIHSIVDQCKAAGVPCFVRQLGDVRILSPGTGLPHYREWFHQIKARKGADQSEWPAELRVREFPEVARE